MVPKKEKKEIIRVGVFVCHCGTNIGGLLDCKALAEYARTLPNVAYSEDNLYTCAETGLTSIKKAIKDYDLNRIVVASCTPRTHEPLFRECISEAGLNPYLFNLVNIREQCSWVHIGDPDEAFDKALDLISMGVAKAIKLEPLKMITIDINNAALIIGGGVSGMTAALNLNNQGFQTYLVEKEEILGGRLNTLNQLFPHNIKASDFVEEIKSKVNNAKKITVFTEAQVMNVNGFVGNYQIEIQQNGRIIDLTVGAIIVAIGASLLDPKNLYKYDGVKIITQYELESKLKEKKMLPNNIVMIQCAGSRNEDIPYCANVCCMTALKNALIIKEKNPSANIVILFRDLYTPGKYEEYYRRTRENDILFIRYNENRLPKVNKKKILVFNEYMGDNLTVPYDLLVLSTPLIANNDNKELAQFLKVPLEANNFFLEAHVKLRPIDFSTDGIFICGSAKWPVDVSESITQGYAAASRASTIISKDEMKISGAIAEIDEEQCIGCGDCRDLCVYNAIDIVENAIEFKAIRDAIVPSMSFLRYKSKVNPAMCKGCGVCVGVCPVGALSLKNFTNEQLDVMLESYLP
ncbi:MAG: CoB--CoM heterodisulfide reductase iron-sulfur subunit A family protein [Promethearchaeota archaeon]